jgi:hypothetical protein
MLEPQALDDIANSLAFVPLIAVPDIDKVVPLLLVTVTVLAALVLPSA